MGAFYETIPTSMIKWILEQKMLWVATAPLSGKGTVNVSPKGGEYFGVIDEKTFWYMELTGSGIETQAHLLEPGNGRITVMFNAFEGPPRILRLWGKGSVLEAGSPSFVTFVDKHSIKTLPGTRAIILVGVHQVGSSCGFSVPYYDFKEFRTTLNDFFEKKDRKVKEGNDKESMDRYWAFKNAYSMDGMPAMKRALTAGKTFSVEPIKKMVGPLAPKNGAYGSAAGVSWLSLLIIAMLSFVMGIAFATYQPTVLSYTVEAASNLQYTGTLSNGTQARSEGPLTAWIRK